MKKIIHYFLVGSLCTLAGCGSDSGNKLAQWSADTFKQAAKIDAHFAREMKPFVRTQKVYQGLQSLVSFSAVLMTDVAQKAYAAYYGKIHFYSQDEIELMQAKLLNENNYYMTLYVIGSQPAVFFETSRSLFKGQYRNNTQQLIGKKDTTWQMALVIDGKTYHPDSINSTNFPVEMKTAFGPLFNQFKTAYVVKFAIKDQAMMESLRSKKENIQLVFTSYQFEVKLDWEQVAYGLTK